MKTNVPTARMKTAISTAVLLLLFPYAGTPVDAASTDIADYPMAVSNMVSPNVLIVYDNSQSMDAFMGGTLVGAHNLSTRGNIGRSVMRDAIGTYQDSFNWGLMSFGMSNLRKLNTYAQYMGSSTGMVFTDDCVGFVAGNPPIPGISTTNGGLRCIANPEPFTGGNYVTYQLSGDDPEILDVLYTSSIYNQLWLINPSNTTYDGYRNHPTSSGNSWASTAFSNSEGSMSFTATDAGFLASATSNPPVGGIQRQLYVPRDYGYYASISGVGTLNVPVTASTTTQINDLKAKLGNGTDSLTTGEIKNGAVFTPLSGTLASAKTYFAGNTSPIQYSCQQNFVMLVTDGLPTGKTDGTLYSSADRTNSCDWSTTTNSCSTGSFGTAATEAISAVQALRTTTNSNVSSTYPDGTGAVTGNFDVQTYVVALGDTVRNALALSVMDGMAFAGGTKSAIPANDASSFRQAITDIADDINARVGAAAAVAVSNVRLTSADNDSFVTSYNSGTWTGDLEAFDIDSVTGIQLTTPLWTSGSASTQLDQRTPASRYIVTSTDTAGSVGGVQFQPTAATTTTKLSSAQQTLLNSPLATDGAAVLAYLRGDRSGEGVTYRTRAHLLGDLINAEPVLVKAPTARYADAGYSTFKTNQANRTRVIFQGSNDGMLHAFAASSGAETWAYIPNLVLGNLNNLSKKVGFNHRYYVDGTPVVGDVDFDNVVGGTFAAPDWRTILVGGLAKGGRGYYALDVTTPTATSEADAQSKVLWEFPNSITNATARASAIANMGYTHGKPIIVKTKAAGWVVLVTSGYNNGTNAGDSGGDGRGHLYVINARTGDLIRDIVTPATCSSTPATNPCGLAHISAYVDSELDNTTDYVYGGDLYGNVWRFNLTDLTSSSSWSVAKFATLKDASGNVQPITSAPELSLIDNMRMIFIGTGQYLGPTDIPGATGANSYASQRQTIYGLRDPLTTALAEPLRPVLQQQTMTTSGSLRTLTNNTVNYTANGNNRRDGWYIDLPSTGERVIGDPTIALSTLVITTNIPSSTKCDPGGSSWEYFINLKTGGLAENSTVTWSGTFLGNGLASRPTIVQLPNGKVVSLTRLSTARTIKVDVPISSTSSTKKRISWREIIR